MIHKGELFAYIRETYGVDPDYPWESDPASAVFRHQNNRKWFALYMEPSGDKLGLGTTALTKIITIKCDPLFIGSLRSEPGILPAYHMNKEHWCTILLGGPLPKNALFHLLDLSYSLTK